MNGSGYLPPFPFQGLGAVGPEVGRRFSAFWVVRKAVFSLSTCTGQDTCLLCLLGAAGRVVEGRSSVF